MSTVLEVLKAGRELIADPTRWGQHSLAQDSEGLAVNPLYEGAVCWCSIGAVEKTAAGQSGRLAVESYDHLLKAMGEDPAEFNDTHTHAEVLAAWDRAIEKVES